MAYTSVDVVVLVLTADRDAPTISIRLEAILADDGDTASVFLLVAIWARKSAEPIKEERVTVAGTAVHNGEDEVAD